MDALAPYLVLNPIVALVHGLLLSTLLDLVTVCERAIVGLDALHEGLKRWARVLVLLDQLAENATVLVQDLLQPLCLVHIEDISRALGVLRPVLGSPLLAPLDRGALLGYLRTTNHLDCQI